MSLILEALKKVERERATPEQRGFLVLGPAAWAPSRSNLGWVLGMVGAAAVAGGVVYVLTRPDAATVPSAPRADERVAAGPAAPIAERPVAPAPAQWGPPPESRVPRTEPRAAAAAPAPADAVAVAEPAPAAAPGLVLNAISERDGVPVAVVNDRVVREGDSFDGVRILRIGASEVEVEVAGVRRTLRF